MPSIVGLGELARLEVFRLAGADVQAAASDDEVRTAWRTLSADTVVVLLTPAAAAALGAELTAPGAPMTVVLP